MIPIKQNLNPFVRLHKISDLTIAKYFIKVRNKKIKQKVKRDRPLKLFGSGSGDSCYFCNLVFKRASDVRLHMCTHTKEKYKKCRICAKQFYSYEERNDHVNSVHKSNGYFKCPEINCKYKSAWADRTAAHVTTHRERRAFTCTLCSKMFLSKGSLQRHIIDTHNPNGRPLVQCPHCPRKIGPAYLKEHIMYVHEKVRNHQCKFCSKKFQKSSNLSCHMRNVHLGEKDLAKCPHKKCQVIFQSSHRARRLRHALNCRFKDPNTNLGLSCKVCRKSFLNKSALLIHMAVHGERERFMCEKPGCGKSFSQKSALSQHDRDQHLSNGQEFTCGECGKSYKTRTSLRIHVCPARASSKKGLICYFCCSSLATFRNLDQHLKLHTKEKIFKCANISCQMIFATSNRAYYHRIKCPYGSSSDTKYICKLCYRPFSSNCYLEIHVAAEHTGERAFKCDRPGCDKRFASKSALGIHQRIHLDKESGRSFPCNQCHKVYKTSASLTSHRLIVHGRGRSCYFCNKRLSTMTGLQSHMRIHTGETPFKCPHCKRNYKWMDNLKYHCKRKH